MNERDGTCGVTMSKNTFNENQRRQLESLNAVQAVNDKTISFTPEFKINANLNF